MLLIVLCAFWMELMWIHGLLLALFVTFGLFVTRTKGCFRCNILLRLTCCCTAETLMSRWSLSIVQISQYHGCKNECRCDALTCGWSGIYQFHTLTLICMKMSWNTPELQEYTTLKRINYHFVICYSMNWSNGSAFRSSKRILF